MMTTRSSNKRAWTTDAEEGTVHVKLTEWISVTLPAAPRQPVFLAASPCLVSHAPPTPTVIRPGLSLQRH